MNANSYQVGGSHYQKMKVQPWDAMEAWMTPEQFKGFLRGCLIKYVARCEDKGEELYDLKKAQHFLVKLIEVVERLNTNPFAGRVIPCNDPQNLTDKEIVEWYRSYYK